MCQEALDLDGWIFVVGKGLAGVQMQASSHIPTRTRARTVMNQEGDARIHTEYGVHMAEGR